MQFKVSLDTTLKRQNSTETMQRQFVGAVQRVSHENFMKQRIGISEDYLNTALEIYESNGSGWRLERVHNVLVQLMALKLKK